MAESESGWTDADALAVDGVYWWRMSENDPDPDICETDLEYGTVYDIGEPQGESIKERGGQFLGPISPSDAEQLMELRKACKAALPYVREVLAYTRSKPRTRCATRTIEQLQKAIGGTNEKAVNRRDVSMERESGIQRVDTDGEPDADNRHSASNDAGGPEEGGGIP